MLGCRTDETPTFDAKRGAKFPCDEWSTTVIVSDFPDCNDPPNQQIPVAGFAATTITYVKKSGNNRRVEATINCEIIEQGGGRGDDFGVLSTTAGLVDQAFYATVRRRPESTSDRVTL